MITAHELQQRGVVAVKIEQLDSNGRIYRTFTYYPRREQLVDIMARLRRAYNMKRTRITIDGGTA